MFKAFVDRSEPVEGMIRYIIQGYYNLSSDAKNFYLGALNLGRGKDEVTFDFLEYDSASAEKVMEEVKKRSDIRLPDFHETMAFLRTYPRQQLQPNQGIVGICGWPKKDKYGTTCITCVFTHSHHTYLSTWDVREPWGGRSRHRFLVVCK